MVLDQVDNELDRRIFGNASVTDPDTSISSALFAE